MNDLDLAAAAMLATADPRLSDIDRWILRTIAVDPGRRTLDNLSDGCSWCREQVFGSVGRLETLGHLPKGLIR